MSAACFRRDVALSRTRLESTFIDPHVDLVGLAVAARRGESEQILRVEFVGNAGERGTEVLSIPDFDIASTSFFAEAVTIRRRAGKSIDAFDLVIAAVARANRMAVATRNAYDFADCGVDVIDPWAA